MDGILVGVFGTDPEASASFASAVGRKSEGEGIAVFARTESGRRYSLLEAPDFPVRIQGCSRVASLSDHAIYLYPRSGRLSAPDGELAVLLSSMGLPGTMEIMDGTSAPDSALSSLKGTGVARFKVEERLGASSSIDLSYTQPRSDFPRDKLLVYVDRAFTVKGVGTVALGFVVSGTVSIHDQIRPIPGQGDLRADVKGIQVSDVDFDSAGRGIRVGLSLRGVEPRDLEKSHWLDDGSLDLSDEVGLEFSKSPFYKQEVAGRDLHVQLTGETVPAKIEKTGDTMTARLPWPVPVWDGMKGAVLDLNGGTLRVAGGFTGRF